MNTGFAQSGRRRLDFRTAVFLIAMTVVFALSMWLRSAFPIYAIGPAIHDDALFVRLAESIGQGNWLGAYDNLTHAKGVGYPLFLAANHLTGLPLKLSEHFLYLLAGLCLSTIFGAVFQTRWATALTFILLAFVPTAWNPGASGRVMREGLYVSLSLLLIALAVRCFVLPGAPSGAPPWRARPASLLLGLVAGFYWITREEGAWLFPSLAIIAAYWLWTMRSTPRPWAVIATKVTVPLLSAALVVGTVDLLNRHWYGVFRNNDFRSADFLAAYGALSRLEHDHWQRHVVFPRDARQRAYRFSPAARELAPAFEGRLGANWARTGCDQMRVSPCQEILSGWFMWALRDAVAMAGHYRSATEAQAFYERLASEINAGCDKNPRECHHPRQTLVPPWRNEYLPDTARASWEIFRTLVTMDGAPVRIASSVGRPRQLEWFAHVTNGPLARPNQRRGDTGIDDSTPQFRLAQRIAPVVQAIATAGIPAALITLCGWCIVAIRRRQLDATLVVALALAAATATRIVLLGFLDATSIPANSMLYLMPVAPVALALVPTVLFGMLSLRHNRQGALPDRQAIATAPRISASAGE